MVRLGGALHLSGAGTGWVVDVSDGAVARRLHSTLVGLFGVRPTIEVHQPTSLQKTRYRLSLPPPAQPLLQRLGLLTVDNQLVDSVVAGMVATPHDAAAYVRGAVMVAGSVSDPRREPHMEIRVTGEPGARVLQRLVERCGASAAGAAQRSDGWRVVSKSGASIGAVLARIGAHGAFLEWDAERLRRELRGEANRATNADGANLVRAATAAAHQVAAIEAAVGLLGWDAIPDDLRQTALARLANPEASLAELGALHDPPVGKATVHRRLARLAALTDEEGSTTAR